MMAHLDSTLEFKYEVSITNSHIERESDITGDDYNPTNVELSNKKYGNNESELKPKQEVDDKMEHSFVNIYDDKFIIKEELLDVTEQQQTDRAQHQLEFNKYENELKDVENVTIKSEILDIMEQSEEADLQMPKPIIKKSESDEEGTDDASNANETSEDEDLVVHKGRKVCEAIEQEKDASATPLIYRRDKLPFNKEPRVVLEDVKLTLGKQNTQESLGEAANNDVSNVKVRNTNSKAYRWCAVPLCTNTSIKTPEKLFIFVPFDKTIRNKWLKLARRDLKGILPTTQLYFCEDHFDLPNDMENYMKYHVMGSVSQIRMKRGCVPLKFHCQSERRKRISDSNEKEYVAKKQRKQVIAEFEQELQKITTIATEQIEPSTDT